MKLLQFLACSSILCPPSPNLSKPGPRPSPSTLSKSSNVGFHLFEEKIPIDPHVSLICEEFKFNSTIAALNGGEDYELLFTISQNDFDKIKDHPFLTVIGHACDKKIGCQMITGLGQQIELTAQGWQSFTKIWLA